MENEAIQARRDMKNQWAHARYQEIKELNNARRLEIYQTYLSTTINHNVFSFDPTPLQALIPEITLQNQHPLIFLGNIFAIMKISYGK